ncbi:hypothetical protein JOC55_001105 [Paenibacillus sacheonensis]|nr:hypothetical protein [Paenibacillus sacheonensis]
MNAAVLVKMKLTNHGAVDVGDHLSSRSALLRQRL